MKSVIRKTESCINECMNVLATLAGYMIGTFMLILFTQVVLRFVFQSPLYGLDEMVTALMIWSMSLGCCTVYWKNEHAVIECLMKLAPEFVKKMMHHITSLIVLVTSIVYIPGGISLFKMQVKLAPVGGLPFPKAYYFALPVLVMGILLVALSLFKFIGYLVTGDEGMVMVAKVEDDGGICLD